MVIELYNNIYVALSNDPRILELLGIRSEDSPEDLLLAKALKIQRRKKPQNLTENIPLLCFFTPGGRRDANNDFVYNGVFIFDVYTRDNVPQAHQITARLRELFSDEIPAFKGLTTLRSRWEDSFESEVDLEDVYCFTSVYTFPVEC